MQDHLPVPRVGGTLNASLVPRPHRRVGWHGQWQAPPAVAAPPAAWGVCRLTTLLCGRLPAGPHPMSAPGSSQRPHVHPPSPRSQGCQQDSILFNPLPCNYPTVARTNTSPPPHHSNPSPPLSQPPPDRQCVHTVLLYVRVCRGVSRTAQAQSWHVVSSQVSPRTHHQRKDGFMCLHNDQRDPSQSRPHQARKPRCRHSNTRTIHSFRCRHTLCP